MASTSVFQADGRSSILRSATQRERLQLPVPMSGHAEVRNIVVWDSRIAAIASDCKSDDFGLRRFESYLSHATQERASATTMTLTGVANPIASDYALAA